MGRENTRVVRSDSVSGIHRKFMFLVKKKETRLTSITYFDVKDSSHYSVCKESRVRLSGLVDFAIVLVNPFLDLPQGQVKFFWKFKLQKNCNQCCSSKIFVGYLKDSSASAYQEQLARMANCKTDFPCNLLLYTKYT